MADELTYVYATGDPELSAGGYAALVSSVDERAFGQEALKENFERLPWLATTAQAPRGRRGRQSPACRGPAGMVTIYLDDDGVRDILERDGARFREALDRILGWTDRVGREAYLTPAPRDRHRTFPMARVPGRPPHPSPHRARPRRELAAACATVDPRYAASCSPKACAGCGPAKPRRCAGCVWVGTQRAPAL